METKVYKVTKEGLAVATQTILRGGLVAFPTETVYGLGSDARSSDAVREIYKVKGRPSDNPLIVHVHKDYDLTELVSFVPEYAKKLAKAFLPGPLTMVYPSKGVVAAEVSCGLDTLAVRVPSHEGAQAFLRAAGIPLAAPSANLSRHVSPTSAQHVYDDLQGKIPVILDGGACDGGIESTVLDVTGAVPRILRAGLVTAEQIASVVGRCEYAQHLPTDKVRSPGVKYKHYAPRAETMLFGVDQIQNAVETYDRVVKSGKTAVLMALENLKSTANNRNFISLGRSAEDAANRLYAALREAEAYDVVIGVAIEESGAGVGVMNRMNKAFGKGESQ